MDQKKRERLIEKLEAHWRSLLDLRDEIIEANDPAADDDSIVLDAADALKEVTRRLNDEVIERLLNPGDFK